MNILADQKPTQADLRAIVADEHEDWTKQCAAQQILRSLERPDIADFDFLIRGKKTLAALRMAGVDTSVVKKIKVGEAVEVELHDRAGEAFDRIVNHTDGKPTQSIHATSDGSIPPPQVVLVHTAPPPPAEHKKVEESSR